MNTQESALLMGILTVAMGFISLVMTYIAKAKLSRGIISKYLSHYMITIFLMIVFTMFYTSRKIYEWDNYFFQVIEYYLMTAAFASLLICSYRTLHIGQHFGFRDVGREMKEDFNTIIKK